jgi:tetratricopeptide (TPR) repeat protein
VPSGAQRDRLFAAFQTEIDSPGALTVAVVEDVHWADEATIDLLSLLGRRLGRMSTLPLATYRDDELGDGHPLRVVLGDLATQRATRRMRVPPLSEAAVRALAAGRDVDGGELYRVTGGNPFYVSEILEAGWPSVPPTVRDAVGARLARAGPGTRQVVESAAVIGTRVDRSLLSTVLGGSGAPVENSLTAGILVADGAGLRFRHELAWMAVVASMAPHRATELHARLQAELEERGDADPAVLAHHAEGAGDEKAVLRHAPEAARRSSELGAHREAAAQFERALLFAGGLEKPALAAVQEGIAGEYSLLDRWEEAERALRAALALRRELGHGLKVGEDLRLLSTTLWRLCRGAEADRAAEQAVLVLEALPPGPELAWAYASLGFSVFESGRTDEGLGFMEQARDLGERQDRADIVSYALNGLGLSLVQCGRDEIGVLERALQVGLDADLHEAAGRAYSSLQEANTRLNRFADSERYHAEGMAYCEGRELGVFSLRLMGWRARTLILVGRWDEATEVCAQMLGRPGISPVNQIDPLQVLGTIRGCRGQDGAWDLLDRALASAEGTGDPLWIAPVRAARAELRWLSGQPDLAAREVSSGYDRAADCTEPWTFGSLVIWYSRLGVPVPADLPSWLPEPYALEMASDWTGAAAAWQRLGGGPGDGHVDGPGLGSVGHCRPDDGGQHGHDRRKHEPDQPARRDAAGHREVRDEPEPGQGGRLPGHHADDAEHGDSLHEPGHHRVRHHQTADPGLRAPREHLATRRAGVGVPEHAQDTAAEERDVRLLPCRLPLPGWHVHPAQEREYLPADQPQDGVAVQFLAPRPDHDARVGLVPQSRWLYSSTNPLVAPFNGG